MKTKILNYSIITAILGFVLWSCKKEISETPTSINTETNLTEKLSFLQAVPSSSNNAEAGPGIRVRITWDEWGRAKRKCLGWGLCNINFEFEPYWEMGNYSSNVTNVEGNNYISQILLASSVPSDIDMTNNPLIVDYDIAVETENNGISETFILKANDYHFQDNLGEFGGYQVDIIKQ